MIILCHIPCSKIIIHFEYVSYSLPGTDIRLLRLIRLSFAVAFLHLKKIWTILFHLCLDEKYSNGSCKTIASFD